MKKTFDFGKIAYTGKTKAYPVTVTVELRKRGGEQTFTIDKQTGEKVYTGNRTPEYIEFSACGEIWNTKHTDIVCGGQCLDEIYEFTKQIGFKDRKTFLDIYEMWKKYHLNGMHAGTPEQEAIVKAYFKGKGTRYDYTEAKAVLEELGFYEVTFTGDTIGKHYDGEPYRYGCGWVIREIDGADLIKIEHLLNA